MEPNFTLQAFLKYRKAVAALFFLLIIYHGQTAAQCWKQVSPGNSYTLALKEDGTLWGWGLNDYGQLGIGTASPSLQLTPIPVGTATDWAYISAGTSHSFAIKSDGTLWAWGFNSSGQLGIGNTTQQNSPVQVGSASNWARVWASVDGGGNSSIGLKTDGTLWAWGVNSSGQLGIGNTTQQNSPVQVGTDADWASAIAGYSHTLAVKTNGTLWAWGFNSQGQLGIGNTSQRTSPVQVGTAADWAAVDAGGTTSAAIKTHGTLWTWGANTNGQFGLGNATNQLVPVQVGTDANWAQVTIGFKHMVALKTNGTIWSWGFNSSGQLGQGNTTTHLVPVQAGTENDWVTVSASLWTSMAMKANKTIWGWGANASGMLGINNTTDQTSPVQAGLISASLPALATGGAATLTTVCGLDITGYSIFVHPTNTFRKLFAIHSNGNAGNFTVVYDSSRNTNTTPLLKSTFENITSLMGRLVSITYSGTIGAGVRVRYYYSPADSINTINSINNWMTARPGANKAWKWVKFEGDAAAMVAAQNPAGFSGSYTELAPDSSGIENGVSFVEFWDLTSFSTFGGMVVATAPPPPPTAQCWKMTAPGNTHTLSIKTDGTLWAWGGNTNGQLGIGNTTSQATPVLVSAATDWASVSAGNGYSLALKTDGTLWAWGGNNNGQLGIGNTTQQNSPVQVGTASDWAFIAANAVSSQNAAIKTNGTLWTWGSNASGQLGIGNTVNQSSPVQVGTDNNWVSIAIGFNHMLALKSNGEIWAWGANTNGQLGIGNTTQQTSPVQTGTANNWAAVGAGGAFNGFSYGIKTDGTLWAWGANNSGQLGIGSTTLVPNPSPLQVGTSNDWLQVIGGNLYVIALKTDGTLWGWGANNSGQLGIAGTGSRTVPVQLSADTWLTATPGVNYALYAKTDQTLWATGTNTSGQLGIGNTTNQPYPVQLTSSNYLPAVPALGGGSATLVQAACITADSKGYYSFLLPSNQARKLFAIHPMGNAGTFTVVYDSSRSTNSSPLLQSAINGATSLMGRLVTVTYSSIISTGVRARFYYSVADSANASNALNSWVSAHPGALKQWQWVKYEGDAAAMAASQTANGFGGTYTRLTPDSSGVENGIAFVEFWNINSFSTFGAVAFANAFNATLPITLNNFTARLQDGCSGVQLNWTTSTEQNSKDFTVQCSNDGHSWSTIGSVTAAGNSSVTQRYSYTDASVNGGIYFYRLLLNDIDGRQKISKQVSVRLDCATGKFFIYPNPVLDVMTVQAPAGGGQKLLTVYMATGQRVEQSTIQPNAVKTISTQAWKAGLYQVMITENGNQVYTQKVIKQ